MKPKSSVEPCKDLAHVSKKKFSKPLMERKRRARINDSLNELKSLVLTALNKDPSRYSKMEKADVLELTVNYLKTLCGFERTELEQQAHFLTGYNECAREVQLYLLRATDVTPQIKAQMLSHIASAHKNVDLSPLNSCGDGRENLMTSVSSPSNSPILLRSFPSPPASPVSPQKEHLPSQDEFLKTFSKDTSFNTTVNSPLTMSSRQVFFNTHTNQQQQSSRGLWRPWLSV